MKNKLFLEIGKLLEMSSHKIEKGNESHQKYQEYLISKQLQFK